MTDNNQGKSARAEENRLKEFEKLRSEIEATLNTVWSNERYGVAAFGAAWSWLATQQHQTTLGWSLPLVIAVAGFLRNQTLYMHLFIVGNYLRLVETKFLGPEGGWDVYFEKHRRPRKFSLRTLGDDTVWIVLAAAGAVRLIVLWWSGL